MPGDDPREFSPYFFNILADFKREEAPIRPAAAEIFMKNAKNFGPGHPYSRCLPMGIPGMVLGTLAYFLGKSAVSRIDSSQGALGGRSVAVAGWVLGVVAMAIGSVVTLVWIVVALVATSQPATGG